MRMRPTRLSRPATPHLAERRTRVLSRRTLITSAIGAASAAALSACSGNGPAGGAGGRLLTVGSKGFAESWINGELYAQALRGLGYQVDMKTNVGSAQLIDAATIGGQIDIYPEYTGVIVMSLAGHEDLMETAEETYQLAREFQAERGITILNPTPFENKNAIAVTQEFAREHNLETIEDLRDIGEFVYSTYPDNVSGGQGYDAIVEAYDLPNMQLQTLNIGLNYQALDNGEIDAADVFTTDPQLLRSDLVVLKDTLNLFGFQNVVPCIRTDVLEQVGGDVPEMLNTINSLLTTEAIQTLNAASAVNRLDPAQVARRFLEANDLV